MSRFKIKSPFQPSGDQPAAIKKISKAFQKKDFQTLMGVTGSGKTFTFAHVIEKLGMKTLVLAPNKTLAAQLFSELREFFPENRVEYFVSYYDYYRPEAYVVSSDTYVEKDSSVNDEIDKLRHAATREILERDDVIVVASVSCIYGIGSPDEYQDHKIVLFEGDTFEREDFIQKLISMQFQRNDVNTLRSTFRVRGDSIDVFPPNEDSTLIRIEFFGDTVEAMTLIDSLTGKILRKLKRMDLYPSSHYVVGKERLQEAMKNIRIELRERLQELHAAGKLVEEDRLKKRTLLDLEMMEEMGFCSGIENYSRHLTGLPAGAPPPTLIDFFGENFLLIVDESHIAIPQVGGMFKGDRSRKENLVNHGFRLPSALDNRPLNFEEFEQKYSKVLFVSATPAAYELKATDGEIVEQVIRPTGLLDPVVDHRPSRNQVRDLLEEIREVIKKGERTLVTTLTKKMAEELTNFYLSSGIKVRYLHSDVDTIERVEILNALRRGEFDVLVGINLLREGLDIPEVSLVGILDADKEGFLRSTRSLIQTIGRAARNVNGRVILYGDKKTESMKNAMHETNRRRRIQSKYNTENAIIPRSVQKDFRDGVVEVLFGSKKTKKRAKKGGKSEWQKMVKEYEKKMQTAAKNLDYEEAAKYRDEMRYFKNLLLQ